MIYCVEDEKNIRELLVYTLHSTGFQAKGMENGEDFFRELGKELPELILLGIMLPGEDGYTILEKIKRMPEVRDIPVIMLTAKGSEFDKVRGLDLGADDYITKPFGMMEFISRIKAVLRRGGPRPGDELRHGPICIRVSRHEVMEHGRRVELTLKEFELLRYLIENQGIVLSRDQLLTRIWGYGFDGETRTVDVHIRTLRQKLGASGACIETVRGVGYRMGDEG